MAGPFSLIAIRSHNERIERAVRDVLLADAVFGVAAWAEDRIYRVCDSEARPDLPWPLILIEVQRTRREPRVGAEYEVTAPCSILCLYEEDRDVVTVDADLTVDSLYEAVVTALTATKASYYLNVPPWDRNLVERIEAIQEVSFDAIAREEPQGFDDLPPEEQIELMTGRVLELVVDYRYTVRTATGQPGGFDPDE